MRNGIENKLSGGSTWLLNKQLHRTDGPAVVGKKQHRAWYIHGRLHRTDGPAHITLNGDCSWYQNGRLHRIDGPAHITLNGEVAWKLHGVTFEFNEWLEATGCSPEMAVMLKLQYG